MENKGIYVLAFLFVLAVVSACSVSIYYQRDNTNSTIHTENPFHNSADSADISLDFGSLSTN